MGNSRVEILGIVLEASPELDVSAFSVEFQHVFEAILIFSNAHLMCHRRGELVCIAALPGRTMYLHSTQSSPGVRLSDKTPQIVETLHAAVSSCSGNLEPVPIRRVLCPTSFETVPQVATAAALGRFLCHSRKRAEVSLATLRQHTTLESQEISDLSSRVLVLKLGNDMQAQYHTTMNCIFAAQRQGIVIDACVLATHASVLMKQAAHLTRGVYLHVSRKAQFEDLIVHLTSAFAASSAIREHMRLPLVDEIDFHANCFCHDPPRRLDQGWVCSVCLSAYCDEHKECGCTSVGT